MNNKINSIYIEDDKEKELNEIIIQLKKDFNS
jgi:hypothetical protein